MRWSGFIVHPRIIYFKGEIKIMAYVKRELQFNIGDRIAQLPLFSYIKGKAAPVERTGEFGSTGKCILANNC